MEVSLIALIGLAAFGLIALVWWLRRRRGSTSGDPFAGLQDKAFESLVTDAFRAQGYELVKASDSKAAAMTGQLLLRRERTTFLVECKHWKSPKVGLNAVQALQRTMATRGATAGFVLSRGRFGREATVLANGCSIRLVDRAALQAMVERIKAR